MGYAKLWISSSGSGEPLKGLKPAWRFMSGMAPLGGCVQGGSGGAGLWNSEDPKETAVVICVRE